MTDDNRYFAVMFEQIVEQNKAILEAVGDMQAMVKHIPVILIRLDSLDNNMVAVKAAIKDLSHKDKEQDRRLDVLEAKTA